MQSDAQTEAALDEVLARALFGDPSFAAWLLTQTDFRDEAAECVFCRCDNPWSSVKLEVLNALTGLPEVLVKECETDILAVYRTGDGRRLALHIENKLAGGSFTPNQPELYRARKEQWKGRLTLGAYTDACTVLIAPRKFHTKFPEQCGQFDAYVSHEQIAEWLPAFRGGPIESGQR